MKILLMKSFLNKLVLILYVNYSKNEEREKKGDMIEVEMNDVVCSVLIEKLEQCMRILLDESLLLDFMF